MRFYITNVEVVKFRNFVNISFPVGKKITLISGQNGVGKSTLLSLIASGSGKSGSGKLHNNFQPLFTEYFHIDEEEDFENYRMFTTYKVITNDGAHDSLVKRLSLKNDAKCNRGVRIIPRTVNGENRFSSNGEAGEYAKEHFSVGQSARVEIPTIYLSVSRLQPLGELYEKKGIETRVTKLSRKSVLYSMGINDVFQKWYNFVIPKTVKDEGELTLVDKTVSARQSLHMDMENIPLFSQSVGQDNVGSIISALVDLYILSQDPDFPGAIMCVDEIDVSLHPDTQKRMLYLLEKIAQEINVQFFLTSHSLIMIEEVLRQQKKSPDDYSLVYFKNPTLPMVTKQTDFNLLREDLFGKSFYQRPKIKVYFEDEIARELFNLLIKAYLDQFNESESKDDKDRIEFLTKVGGCSPSILVNIKDQLELIPMKIGCEDLLKLSIKDDDLKRKIFVIDGDARFKSNKPMIKDYIDDSNFEIKGQNDRSTHPNVCFLPSPFAPESFLYRIIYQISHGELDHYSFWNDLDSREITALYTPDKVRNLIDLGLEDYNNDDIKKKFGSNTDAEIRIENNDLWKFVIDSNILSYYFRDIGKLKYLVQFVNSVVKAYKMAYSSAVS